jgi:hypothetical protein
MCNGPSRPPRLRPQGFSPSRRFPRIPGLRGLRPHVSVESYMPLPFRTCFPFKVPPAGIACPFRDRWLPRRSGWRRVLVRTLRALISLDFLRLPRPSGPPSPRRQDCSRATSCAADLGAVAGRGPGLKRRFTRAEAPVSSSPAGTSNRAHPRDAPSTSERSSSRVPDALPRTPLLRTATGSWVVTFVGFCPSRALIRRSGLWP